MTHARRPNGAAAQRQSMSDRSLGCGEHSIVGPEALNQPLARGVPMRVPGDKAERVRDAGAAGRARRAGGTCATSCDRGARGADRITSRRRSISSLSLGADQNINQVKLNTVDPIIQ